MASETVPSAAPLEELPRADLAREIEARATQLSTQAEFPASRVSRIRSAAARLAVSEFRPDDLRASALFLERQATIDVQVPTASRLPGVALVKRVIKKSLIWYLRFIAHQVTAFGQATARFGVSVANRVDGMESDIAELEDRVAKLEAALADRAGS